MTITRTEKDNTVTLVLDGWLDTLSTPELKEEYEALDKGIESLVIDMEKLQYVSSAGIRQLVTVSKKMKENFVIRNASDALMDIFHITGLDRIIRFE